MFIDGHCHLADPRFGDQLAEILLKARGHGVEHFIQGGVGPEDWDAQLELSRVHAGIHCCFGLHPWWVAERSVMGGPMRGKDECERAFDRLPSFLDRAVGLGELGLDHGKRFPESTRALQRELFVRQLGLARERGLPLVLHVVRAHEEAFEELRGEKREGIVHAFGGGWEVAKRYLDLGLTISVGGVAARENHETLARAIARIPLDRLVIESDSPDLPPPSYQGRLNEPSSILEVARAVGLLKQVDPVEVLEQSRANLERIFKLELKKNEPGNPP